MKKLLLGAAGIVLSIPCLYAQTSPSPVHPLHIGDRLNIDLSRLINFKPALSPIKDKPILLDFWNTRCTSCIAAMPELYRLQQQFGDSLHIILVTTESLSLVQSFAAKNRIMSLYPLPSITNDSLLWNLFPHQSEPHEIWLSGSGIVQAVTGGKAVNDSTLRRLSREHPLQLPLKQDALAYNRDQPLLEDGNGGTDNDICARSLFTHYLPGIHTGSHNIRYTKGLRRRVFVNWPLLPLLHFVIARQLPFNQVVLNVKDKSRYIPDTNHQEQWTTAYSFCYEQILPDTLPVGAWQSRMLHDIENFFSIKASVETESLNCYVLTADAGALSLLRAKDTSIVAVNNFFDQSEENERFCKHCPITLFIGALNRPTDKYPLPPVVVNETGIDFLIDLQLPVQDLQNLSSLAPLLTAYGLHLTPSIRSISVLKITETD